MSKYGEYRRNREDGGDKVGIWKNGEGYEGMEGNIGGFCNEVRRCVEL